MRDQRTTEMPKSLDISTLKFFWQLNPIRKANKNTVPRFLRDLPIFKNFTDMELKDLTKYMHERQYLADEEVFHQNDQGIGFYIIYSGKFDVRVDTQEGVRHVTSLQAGDYFGELGLLQNAAVRSATCVSETVSTLLGICKPDMEEMIIRHPLLAAKLLQSISLIIANRLYSITKEVTELKDRIRELEEKVGTDN